MEPPCLHNNLWNQQSTILLSPVDDDGKAFKNNFSLQPPANDLIFWIYIWDGVHWEKI